MDEQSDRQLEELRNVMRALEAATVFNEELSPLVLACGKVVDSVAELLRRQRDDD